MTKIEILVSLLTSFFMLRKSRPPAFITRMFKNNKVKSHPLEELFQKLELDSDVNSIQKFIERNRPIPDRVALPNADFWTKKQADFLRVEIVAEGGWEGLIKQLDQSLRNNGE